MTFAFEKERITAISSDGIPMGYITFPWIRSDLVNINQVTTYPRFRGQGVAEAMTEALLTRLSEENRKAALTCPFAQNYVEQHPQWKHLLPGGIHFPKY